MIYEPSVKRWTAEISDSQSLFDLVFDGAVIEITRLSDKEVVKWFVLDDVYTNERETFIECVLPHLPASRNWRYELKQKLNGKEKLTVWAHTANVDVLKEIADAMLRYPVLTAVMLRCSKTGHNVSLANVDKKMQERKEKGFYK